MIQFHYLEYFKNFILLVYIHESYDSSPYMSPHTKVPSLKSLFKKNLYCTVSNEVINESVKRNYPTYVTSYVFVSNNNSL